MSFESRTVQPGGAFHRQGAAGVLAGGAEGVGDGCGLGTVDCEDVEHIRTCQLAIIRNLTPHHTEQRPAGEVFFDPRVFKQQLEVHIEDAGGAVAALDVAADPEEGFGDTAQHEAPPSARWLSRPSAVVSKPTAASAG